MPVSPFESILSKLPDARPVGGSSQKAWKARCPAHADSKPSLCVSDGGDGRVLIHCHAGCPPEAIVEALGLRMADLMPQKAVTREASEKGRSGLYSSTKSLGSWPSRPRLGKEQCGPAAPGWGKNNVAQPPPAGERTPPRAGVPHGGATGGCTGNRSLRGKNRTQGRV